MQTEHNPSPLTRAAVLTVAGLLCWALAYLTLAAYEEEHATRWGAPAAMSRSAARRACEMYQGAAQYLYRAGFTRGGEVANGSALAFGGVA